MGFQPMFDNVVIKRDEGKSKTEGGILLPDTAKEEPKRGTVMAAGPGVHRDGTFIETKLKIGQKVLFAPFAGNTVKIDGQELIVMKESEVFGVFA